MLNLQQFVRTNAPRYGLDPAAVLAIAYHESGARLGAVGDNGSSFGPWQLHVGGALPAGKGAAWANSQQGLLYALQRMSASGAKGLTGRAAVSAISRNFERPANPGAEITDALAHYGQFSGGASGGGGGLIPQVSGGGTGSHGPAMAAHPARQNLLQSIMQTNQNFAVTGQAMAQNPLLNTSVWQNGLTNADQAKMGNVRPPAGMAAPGKAGGIVQTAKKFLGTPYVWGGTSPKGFDCSGLIQYVYAQHGINLPRTTYQQINSGKAVKWGTFQPGDLIFSDFEGSGKPTHVVMYVGNGKVIAAPHTGTDVQIENVNIFRNNFIGARRVVG